MLKSKKQKVINSFKYQIGDKMIYTGKLYDDYTNCECEIVDKNRVHQSEYYKVKFADGLIITVKSDWLKTNVTTEGEQHEG